MTIIDIRNKVDANTLRKRSVFAKIKDEPYNLRIIRVGTKWVYCLRNNGERIKIDPSVVLEIYDL